MVSGKKVPEPFLIEFLVGISLKIQLKSFLPDTLYKINVKKEQKTDFIVF